MRSLPAANMPRVSYHKFEVVVPVDRRANVSIVLDEFIESDDSVFLALVPCVDKVREN